MKWTVFLVKQKIQAYLISLLNLLMAYKIFAG